MTPQASWHQDQMKGMYSCCLPYINETLWQYSCWDLLTFFRSEQTLPPCLVPDLTAFINERVFGGILGGNVTRFHVIMCWDVDCGLKAASEWLLCGLNLDYFIVQNGLPRTNHCIIVSHYNRKFFMKTASTQWVPCPYWKNEEKTYSKTFANYHSHPFCSTGTCEQQHYQRLEMMFRVRVFFRAVSIHRLELRAASSGRPAFSLAGRPRPGFQS